jgi:hypothetical protein
VDVFFTLDARKALASLDQLQAGLSDATREPIRGGFVRAGLIYFRDMRARYQGAMNGDGTWAPLAPATVRAKHGDRRILYRTGALFNDVPPANFNRAIQVSSTGLKAFVTNPIAKYHQRGGRRLPQRKILVDPRPAARALMIQAIRDAADAAVSRVWPNRGRVA